MKKNKRKSRRNSSFEQIRWHAAGIDIGDEEIYVAVPPDRDEEPVRRFATFTADLHTLADWLEACDIETAAMESTGIYWVPLFEILESRGLEVFLVNAQHVKNVSGRKSDVLDCQWLQQLHSYGLLSASFRPPEEILALRSLVRHREMLVRYRASHIQHMQKALHVMNLKLTNVLSDITGVTGLKIIRAIITGERDPEVLASYRHGQCRYSEEEIAKALEGHYKSEQVFALKQALEMYEFYGVQMQACDAELEARYAAFDPPEPPATPPPAVSKKKCVGNEPYFDLAEALYRMTGVDLTAVDGLGAATVQDILTEIGTDMSKWPTVKHFASWLRLAPNNKVTGGKVKQRSTLPTHNRANKALRLAAQSLARSDSSLGAYYRRIRAKHGPPVAITATAHKLARIIYFMLKRREPYQDVGADYYDQQYKARVIRNLQRRAQKLGMRLEPIPS